MTAENISWSISNSDGLRVNRYAYLIRNNAYHIYHKFSDRNVCTNTVDPDQTPQNAASDMDLHCLLLIQVFGSTVYKFTIDP